MNEKTLTKDAEYMIEYAGFIPWNSFRNCSFFITGATGLIGGALTRSLYIASIQKKLGIKIIILVRDIDDARKLFSDISDERILKTIVGCVEDLPEVTDNVDYIIHCASHTDSKAFVENPVEVIRTADLGTYNILELSKKQKTKGMVYLSTMEVYGFPPKGHMVTEKETGSFSPMNIRNSYPISKLLCESMCNAYYREYGIRTIVLRLTQTFGPGIREDDNRLFAYFARCIQTGENIHLKTDGKTERSYLYIMDAVSAILVTLARGDAGETYNVANEDTYCSVSEMAKKIGQKWNLGVEYDPEEKHPEHFPDTVYINLDTKKLRDLGWYPHKYGIEEMYRRMIFDM